MRVQREDRVSDRAVRVRKEPKLLKRFLATIRSDASAIAEMTGQICDFHLAFARHWTARFRRRFIKPDAPLFSLADEIDFVKFCRDLKKPITDPVMRQLLEEDVDWLWDVKCYRC